MLVVKKTGLVPVRSIKRGGRPDIYGVPPATARAALKAGEVELVDIPASIETFSVPGPEPEVLEVEEPKVTEGPVEIPDNWADLHALTWITLAKKITGSEIVLTDQQKQDDVKPSQVAKEIIEAEIQRRSAVEPVAE